MRKFDVTITGCVDAAVLIPKQVHTVRHDFSQERTFVFICNTRNDALNALNVTH